MFTGIVQGIAHIEALRRSNGLHTFRLRFPHGFDQGLEIGASVAVEGVCLTVTRHDMGAAEFDVMQETLLRSTLASFNQGDSVNIERAARDGAEIGGHPLSGHVDCTATIVGIETPENNRVLRFQVPPQWMHYVFAKGYIAVNGCSLTVSAIDRAASWFEVWLIPETLRATTFSAKKVGDLVNIEIERGTQVTVDTIRNYLDERLGPLLPRLQALLGAEGDLATELATAALPAPDKPQ